MIQCVSDSNPYDDEPDFVEIGEIFIKRHTYTGPRTGLIGLLRKATGQAQYPTPLDEACDIIQGLLEYIEENV
jgi:hypothetical protein